MLNQPVQNTTFESMNQNHSKRAKFLDYNFSNLYKHRKNSVNI